MRQATRIYTIILLFFSTQCGDQPQNEQRATSSKDEKKEELQNTVPETVKKEEPFVLTEEDAIPFFFKYAQENSENKVRVTTRFGSFDIELYDRTPYHRANFIYLTRKKYFNGTYFHRVVPDFIIQGGSSDKMSTGRKRREIGKYLLPPDTEKGYKHHRGVVSMPSSEIDNPYKLASPYEFFIVTKKGGAHHLDGGYTAFGKVIRGMDVVDEICGQPTDDGEWPIRNVEMAVEVIE